MKIRNKKLRDLASIVFTVYYLIAAEQADEKVRKVRAVLTVDHLRVAWNKPNTPYLSWFTNIMRPRFTKYPPRALRIPRPKSSAYKDPVEAWMYFDGTLAELKKQDKLVLDVPGGGFVAMDPRTSDDKLLAWAGRTGLPILSLNYRKAPEFPYPYALYECFDVYTMIVATRGRVVGLEPDTCPRIVLTGDSAGGNLATGTALMVLQSNESRTGITLPTPAGLVLMYPTLDMNIGSWMTDDQMALIKNPRTAKRHENFVRRKSEDIDKRYTPSTPRPEDHGGSHYFSAKDFGDEASTAKRIDSRDIEAQKDVVAGSKPQPLRTRLAVSSVISYFGDRILTPEMMRAIIILYVGPYNRPDFTTDYLLCPAVAPESLLAKFPKTYFLTGERDPLVDDTVIFAGRLRQAKLHLFNERREMGLEKSHAQFVEKDHVEVVLIPGISHGFVQFVSVFPQGWKHIFRCAKWIEDIFAKPPHPFEGPNMALKNRLGLANGNNDSGSSLDMATSTSNMKSGRHHHRTMTGDSSADEDAPLAMSSLNSKGETPPTSNGSGSGGRGRGKGRGHDSRPESPELDRSKSVGSLGSEEDLLKRRMKGLTISLMGS